LPAPRGSRTPLRSTALFPIGPIALLGGADRPALCGPARERDYRLEHGQQRLLKLRVRLERRVDGSRVEAAGVQLRRERFASSVSSASRASTS